VGKPTVFIDGEAGTTGLQIKARLESRDDLELVSIAHEQRKDDGERARLLNAVDLAILCLHDDVARAAVAMITNPAVKVLDASTAHRVNAEWEYGFPELTPDHADRIRTATRVANPGCYPTGAIALLRPLVDAGLVPADLPISIHAVSGYSGGGRQMIEKYEGDAQTDPYFIYALTLEHKHVPEMRHYAGLSFTPLFVPSVGAFRQGMLVQVPLHLRMLPTGVSGPQIHEALVAHYAGQRYVRVMPFGDTPATLAPEALNDTNMLELFIFANPAAGQVLLVARLDNLGKGASGAAVQNLELMLGL